MSTTAGTSDSHVSLVIELRASSLFSALTLEELLPLARTAERVEHKAGARLFEQGEEATHLYVVVSGRVEVVRDGQRLAELGPGEHFGEMGLLDGSLRAAAVAALSDTVLVRIGRQDFNELMELYPRLGLSVARVLSARIRAASAQEAQRLTTSNVAREEASEEPAP